VSLFLSGCPLWVTALLVVVVPTAASTCGLILTRRVFGLELLTNNNEVAGFKFAVVGVLYAVLIAFAVIVVWERFTEAELAVVQEAGAAATIYRLSAGTEPEAVTTRAALGNYLTLAVTRDWPQMAREHESPAVTQALNALYAATLRYTRSGERPAGASVELFHQLDVMTSARRTRLQLAVGIVPSVLWFALVVGGILTVGFTFFFGTANFSAQVMMTGILAVIVFIGLFVIVAIDHPFTGPVFVDSEPLQRVLTDFGGG
jgi:hypothetical protein